MTAGGFRLTKRDSFLLSLIYAHRFLLAEQIVGLGSFGSMVRCRARLRRLREQGLLDCYRPSRIGLDRLIYRPTLTAISNIARTLGISPIEIRRNLADERSLFQLDHTLAATDFRVAVQRDADRKGASVAPWLPELLCRHEYAVRGPRGWEERVLKPDAFTVIVAGHVRLSFFVEIDLGHVSRERFRAKLHSYRQYQGRVFQETYGENGFGILVVTTVPKRLGHLMELVERCDPTVLITTLDALRDGALSPVWHQRGSSALLSPLDLGAGGSR